MTRAGDGSVFRRTAWYTVGRVGVLVLGGAVTAAATRTLGEEGYGRLALFLAAVQLLALVVEGSLRTAVAHRQLNQPERSDDLMRTVLVLLVVGGVAAVALGALLRAPLGVFLGLTDSQTVLACAASAFVAIWGPWQRLLVVRKQSRAVAGLELLRGGLQHSITLAAVLLTASVLPAVLGVSGVLCVLGACVLVHWWRRFPGRFSTTEARWALAMSLPLLPHSLSHLVLAQLDRFIVAQASGLEAAGLYSFGYSIGMLMGTVVSSLQNAYMPDFIEGLGRDEDGVLRRDSLRHTVVVTCGAFALVVAGEELGLLLGPPSFQQALAVVPPVVMGYALTWVYTLYLWQSWQAGRTGAISAATAVAGAANIGLNYLLVPRYGYIAAAWTTLASYLLLVVLHWGIVRLRGERRLSPLPLVAVLATGALAAVGYGQLRPLFDSWGMALVALKVPLAVATALVLWRFGRPAR